MLRLVVVVGVVGGSVVVVIGALEVVVVVITDLVVDSFSAVEATVIVDDVSAASAEPSGATLVATSSCFCGTSAFDGADSAVVDRAVSPSFAEKAGDELGASEVVVALVLVAVDSAMADVVVASDIADDEGTCENISCNRQQT